jgi:selT/selW/selH-like putative selenoprotein
LAAEIAEATGIKARLIEGSRGIFDVAVDGRLVYSKYETGRFPEPGEVVAQLAGMK